MELNTQKLAESKYLCPLSGKKFKGPDYVRKHIFNKHMDKVEEFKQEVGSIYTILCIHVLIVGSMLNRLPSLNCAIMYMQFSVLYYCML